MSKSICIFGESRAGKTTFIRTLKPQETYYIDADKKGLSWRGWREHSFLFLKEKKPKNFNKGLRMCEVLLLSFLVKLFFKKAWVY